ncbi:MAG: hypothetical protein VXZ72_03665 [Chlamydiota bacterium]|nr:hypothetical protein [Chlamydiota bacterium]
MVSIQNGSAFIDWGDMHQASDWLYQASETEDPPPLVGAIQRSASDFRSLIRVALFFHLSFLLVLLIGCFAAGVITCFGGWLKILPLILMGCLTIFLMYSGLTLYWERRSRQEREKRFQQFFLDCSPLFPSASLIQERSLLMAEGMRQLALALNLADVPIRRRGEGLLHWMHNKLTMREQEAVIHASIEWHLAYIRYAPLDADGHASLGTTYLTSHSYLGSKEKRQDRLKEAIQEFQVVRSLRPKDPWPLSQIANCYFLMGKSREERLIHEELLALCPDDKEVLFRLGELTFRQGLYAKGLKIYQQLNEQGYQKAEHLFSLYCRNS